MTFHPAAYRVYSRWMRTSDHSRRTIYAAINDAYEAGRVDAHRPQFAPAPCQEETYSWDHFTSEQVDAYWIRCTLQGPHGQHEDENTGLTWVTPRVEHAFRSLNGGARCVAIVGHLASGEQCGRTVGQHVTGTETNPLGGVS